MAKGDHGSGWQGVTVLLPDQLHFDINTISRETMGYTKTSRADWIRAALQHGVDEHKAGRPVVVAPAEPSS